MFKFRPSFVSFVLFVFFSFIFFLRGRGKGDSFFILFFSLSLFLFIPIVGLFPGLYEVL